MNLVVDANVLVSAVLGRSIDRLLALSELDVRLLVPMRMMEEAQKVIVREAGVSVAAAVSRLALLAEIVEVVRPEHYLAAEEPARCRLSSAGQPDWPVLATALVLDGDVWSNDRDLFGTGVPVWSTGNIKHLQAELA